MATAALNDRVDHCTAFSGVGISFSSFARQRQRFRHGRLTGRDLSEMPLGKRLLPRCNTEATFECHTLAAGGLRAKNEVAPTRHRDIAR